MNLAHQRLIRAVTALAVSIAVSAAAAGSAVAAGGDYTQVVCASPDTAAAS